MKKIVFMILTFVMMFSVTKIEVEAARKPDRYINIHYKRKDADYDNFRYIWLWGDTTEPGLKWPKGRMANGKTKFGVLFKVPLRKNAKYLGMILMDDKGNKDMGDKIVENLPEIDNIFLYQGDNNIYLSPVENYKFPDKIENIDNSPF